MSKVKLNLNKYWWHRLLKVLFWISVILVAIFSGLIGWNTSIVATLDNNRIEAVQSDYFDSSKTYIQSIETNEFGFAEAKFYQANKDKDFYCVTEEKRLKWIPSYLFESTVSHVDCHMNNVVATSENHLYGEERLANTVNYLLLATLIWSSILLLIYFKGIIYIVFGSRIK